MKFHLIVISLAGACIYLLYLFIFGFKSELAEARHTIRQESVQSVRNSTKINEKPELKPFINKALQEPSRTLERSTPDPVISPETKEDYLAVNPEVFTSRLDEKDYWCRNVNLVLDSQPVKCMYPDACFGCTGPIIPPEVPTARPICADGSESQLYHVECCPSLSGSGPSCPSVEQCFNAELVPAGGCQCNDSPNCHLESTNGTVECVCKD